jgi:hypothetical protein
MSQPKLDPSQILTGTALGIATLDGSGQLSASQIPSSISGAIVFKGTWDASTNTPTLYSGNTHGEVSGWEYIVSVAGNTNIDGGNPWIVGDALIHNGTVWNKVPSTAGVTSITGTASQIVASSATGAVTLSLANPIDVNTSGNAATVTTNANLTGPITSSGNATSIASQTGTGSTFVMSIAPTITGHPTIEGVTSAGATGTGNLVFSASPTITGHPTIEGVTSAGATGTGNLVFDTSPTLGTPTLTSPVINGTLSGTGVASANTASTLMLRDASGNFAAGVATVHGVSTGIRTMTTAGSVALTDATILANTTFTITLLNPSTAVGRTFVIKNIGIGIITIVPFGAETIDGNTGIVISRRWDSVTIQTDGTNWYIL